MMLLITRYAGERLRKLRFRMTDNRESLEFAADAAFRNAFLD